MESSCLKYSSIMSKSQSSFATMRNEIIHRSTLSLPLSKKKSPKMASCSINGNFHLISNSPNKKIDAKIHEYFEEDEGGIGIVRFLRGKNFLITGATGFLAKVLIEKILRTSSDVGKIYIIIKAKDDETARQRLVNEIVNTVLFQNLQEMHGEDYLDFMLRKIVPIVGNVREANIGIKPEILEQITEEIDVIVNSAANTTFDERYDVALDINTIGPFRLMSLAKRMKRLKLFLHVSTAYVNGQRQGVVSEKPFLQGDTISSEIIEPTEKKNPILDIEEEIKLAFNPKMNGDDDASISQEMKELGLQRAKLYGWQDTYVFTKAMGEMVINSMRGDMPVVIIRPSVIESTFKDPFPGWMEGNRMMDPIVLYYGKGQLDGFLVDPTGVLDVVPVDMVVNATLAAMAKHGSKADPCLHIYQIASSNVNPLFFDQLSDIMFQHFNASPYIDPKGQPIPVKPLTLFTKMEEYSDHVSKDAVEKSKKVQGLNANEKIYERLKTMYVKVVQQAKYLANLYEPYTFYNGRFGNENTEGLINEMSEEERKYFQFDVKSINWKDYIANVHIPGLRKHVMKGRGTPTTKPQI